MRQIKKLLHNVLGWGFRKENQGRIGGDDWQPTYECQFCDLEITQDSTGAWFHLSEKPKYRTVTYTRAIKGMKSFGAQNLITVTKKVRVK